MTPTSSAGSHSHDVDLSALASADALDKLLERIEALEAVQPLGSVADLQGELNDARAGDIIDLRGFTYPGPLSVPKAVHLTNGYLTGKPSDYVLTVTADALFTRLTVRGGYIAIAPKGPVAPQVVNCFLLGLVYGGVITFGAYGALVRGNVIDGVVPIDGHDNWNAYGIAFTSGQGYGDSQSCKAIENIVRRVPTWHGADTHGGNRHEFRGNVFSGVRSPIWVTGKYVNVVVDGNILVAPTAAEQAAIPAGCPVAYGTDINAISSTTGGTLSVTNNQGIGWPAGRWYHGASSGGAGGTLLASSGNSPSVS